jgi:polyhydroxyalkanoate synthase
MTTMPSQPPSPADPAVLTKRLYEQMEQIYKSSLMSSKLATGKMLAKVGQTPKEKIWSLNKTSLYHYYPQVPPERRHATPLLLVFALINRPYIFDLRPGNSFVEHMVREGYEVYLLDWGAPGPEDAHLSFDDYTLDYLPRAIRKMQTHSGSRDFSMLGWCIGATISTVYAASRPDDGLRNLVLLTAPLDFSDKDAGPFNIWLKEEYYNVDALAKQMGIIPGEMIDWGSKMLKPVENFIGNYIKLWDNLDEPAIVESWQAMNTWVTDPVPFAGAAFRQWVVEFFRENRLMENKLMMRGQIVDVADIKANFLNVIADKDHIVPTCQSTSVMDRIGSDDKQLMAMPGGHIGMMAGSGARKRVWPQIDAWLAARSN